MYSMTGYGKGEYRGEVELTVEIKSVNNRYLDMVIKCPHIFASQEENIRSLIRKQISRGRLDVFVNFTDKRERKKNLYVDIAAVRSYLEAAKQIETETGAINDITTSFLLKAPDVVRQEEENATDEVLAHALAVATENAVLSLKEMRKKEGERMKHDLLSRVKTISVLREKIAERAPLVAEEYRIRLTERMTEYLAGKIDENRILLEAALFADKCNIDEELTRLSSHIQEFYSICEAEAVGRKLDFLIQEFNRECNTICSKSNDAAITSLALELKNEIEKVREQIQNLE